MRAGGRPCATWCAAPCLARCVGLVRPRPSAAARWCRGLSVLRPQLWPYLSYAPCAGCSGSSFERYQEDPFSASRAEAGAASSAAAVAASGTDGTAFIQMSSSGKVPPPSGSAPPASLPVRRQCGLRRPSPLSAAAGFSLASVELRQSVPEAGSQLVAPPHCSEVHCCPLAAHGCRHRAVGTVSRCSPRSRGTLPLWRRAPRTSASRQARGGQPPWAAARDCFGSARDCLRAPLIVLALWLACQAHHSSWRLDVQARAMRSESSRPPGCTCRGHRARRRLTRTPMRVCRLSQCLALHSGRVAAFISLAGGRRACRWHVPLADKSAAPCSCQWRAVQALYQL